MDVIELNEQNRCLWDAYVCSEPNTTAFHLLGWKNVFENTFKLKTHYIMAVENGRVFGILPLLFLDNFISGSYLTSMSGGMCASRDQAAEALLDKAVELVKSTKAKYLVLRDGRSKWDLPGLLSNEDHCTFLVRLDRNPNEVWRKISRDKRRQTTKAMESGLQVIFGKDCLERFYPAYLLAMRAHGTPTQGRRFFLNAADELDGMFNLLVVEQKNNILGGGSIGYARDTITCAWAGMIREFYNVFASQLMYWEVLKHGCENGYQWADLGRSRWNSGSYNFKLRWGAEPQPLYQQFYLNGQTKPPQVGSSMEEKTPFRIFISVWKHLPLGVTEKFGPQVRRVMPLG